MSSFAVMVQLGSGTTTVNYAPVYSYFGYSYTQQIYLGSELTNAGGGAGPITKIRFYYSSGTWNVNSSGWTVYMGNTSKTIFASTTDWVPVGSMTQVFSGTITTPVAGTWLEITLSTPFDYTGGNLVIAIDENTASYTSSSTYWRSFAPGGNRALYAYSDGTNPNPASPPAGSLAPGINQIQFEMTAFVPTTPPNCATIVSPANAATGVSKFASLNWASGGGAPTGYKLFFGTDNPPTNLINGTDLGLVTTYSPVMDYVTPYYWQIVPYNVNGDASGCTVWSFTTMADPTITAFPYVENFDGTWAGTPAAPTNWTVINANSDLYFWKQANTYISPTHSLPYAAHGMGNSNDWLITPPINLTDFDAIIKWWDKVESATYANKYKVFVSTTTPEIASFTNELGDFNCINVPWTEHSLDLSAFNGQTVYVAFYQYFSGSTFYGFGIDDFSISEKPTIGFLSGIALDINNNPLEGVLVTADLAKATTTTDASGEYSLELAVGTYDVVFTKLGFYPQTFEGIEILGGETTTQNAILEEIPGSNCGNAIVVNAFPFEALNQTNCGYGNNYSETCLASYDGGDDIMYEFTIATVKDVVITINPKTTTWVGILLASDCPPVTCVDFKTNGSATTPMMISQRLEAGTYYIMIDTWPTPDCVADFDLTITAEDPPPPGKITGLVFDVNNNRLPNVKVTLSESKEIVYTNALGRYNFNTLEPGTYELIFSKENYFDKTYSDVVVNSSMTTVLNVTMDLIPPPFCPTLVFPAVDQIVLSEISLEWAPSGPNPATGYKIFLYNTTTEEWIEENTDLGNVTTYTPAEPFEPGCYYAWLIAPYNFAGETSGCEPWFFYTAYSGFITGVITDTQSGLPLENVAVFVQQTLPGNYSETVYTDATGAYSFEWESGNYNLTFSKFGYLSKTITNVPVNPTQTTVRDNTLDPVVPYNIPFAEAWGSGSFATQQWSVVPPAANWSVLATAGNPAPAARFNWGPQLTDYSSSLQSHFIDGTGYDKLYAQFDLFLQNYDLSTVETMSFVVFDGMQWNEVQTFTNQGGSIAWNNFSFDISEFAAGKLFQLGFKAEGEDSYNIDWWYIDNITVRDNLMAVQPPAIYDQLSSTGTSDWPITISNPGTKALWWNATLNIPEPWAVLSASSGVVSAGGQQIISLTFDGSAVPPGVYEAEIVISGANGVVQEIISIQLDIYEMIVNPLAIQDVILESEVTVWEIKLTNPGTLPLDWNAIVDVPWATLSATNGSLLAGADEFVQVTFDGSEAAFGINEGSVLFSAAGGLVQQVVDLSLDVYSMEPDQDAIKDALPIETNEDYIIEISYNGGSATDWEASFIDKADLPWAQITPTEGTVEPGGKIIITLTFKSGSTKSVTYESSILITAADGLINIEIPLLLLVFGDDEPFQKVMIPAANNWGFVSTFVDLESKATLEELLVDVKDDMIIMIGNDGIYWPSQLINSFNPNTWDTYKGFKVKMGQVGLLVFEGEAVATKTATFTAGTHLIPVLSEFAVPTETIFGGANLGKIEFAFGLDGSIYWPFGGVYSLEELVPGYGYLVKFNTTTTLDFNVTKGATNPNSIVKFENITPWNDVNKTGDVHIVGVSGEAAGELQKGDIIGVFNLDGLCTGMAIYEGNNQPFAIAVFGNDMTNAASDGMNESEPMIIKVFSNGEVTEINPVYDVKLPNHNGMFALNGLSMIIDLKLGSTGIGNDQASALRIYPNPSNGLFTIDGINNSYKVVVMNAHGQVVYNTDKMNSKTLDLTNQPTGVYFIRLIGTNQTITNKVVIQ